MQATLEGKAQPPAFGALVFTCNGRGMNLYGEPNYDSATLASYVPVPLSGIFCNGELPPGQEMHLQQMQHEVLGGKIQKS